MSFYDDASLAFLASGGAGKDGKAYSIKPTDGSGDFTFSRGSNLTATRVDSNGLIEKGRENLLYQSNQFDTTWTTSNASVTSGQSGYDGSSDAWLLEATGASSTRVQQTISSDSVQTISVYAKKGTSDYFQIRLTGSTTAFAFFDLANGTLGTLSNQVDASITSVGNGWYRCSLVRTGAATSARIYVTGNNTTSVSVGDNIYIQDAQVEQGLVATEYIESGATTGKAGILEDSPRFDYSGGASCPSLLLEPSKTQLVPYTEYLDTSTNWSAYPTSDPVTHTQNYAISPDGTKTASLLGNFTSGGFNVVNNSNFRTNTLATQNPLDDTYTMSVWLKTTSGTGTISILNRGLSSGTNSPQSLQCNVTNEWQRFDLSNTYTAAEGASSLGFIIIKSTSDTLEEVLVWGAQLEEGSYPTSYIPNHSGGSVTRNADVCTKTSISSLIGQTEGTIYCEFEYNGAADSGVFNRIIGLGTGVTQNRILLAKNDTTAELLAFAVSGGTTQVSQAIAGTSIIGHHKVAISYKANEYKVYLDGELEFTDTSASVPATTDVYIGTAEDGTTNNELGGVVKQSIIFKDVLSVDDCKALTTI